MPVSRVGRLLPPIICRWALHAVVLSMAACGGSPTAPTATLAPPADRAAVLAISAISATVESLAPGTLYRIQVSVRETTGIRGASLVHWKAVFGAGWSSEADFTGPGVLGTPRVDPHGTLRAELHVSFQTDVSRDSQVTTTLLYTDDEGHSGQATATTTITAVSGT
jgi:hypothetical protein